MENISREELALVAQQLENELASRNAEIAMLKSKIQSQAEMMDTARKEILVLPHLNASLMHTRKEAEDLRKKNAELTSELRRVRAEASEAVQGANSMAANAVQDVMRAMVSQQENLSAAGGDWGFGGSASGSPSVRGMPWSSSSSLGWGSREPFQPLHEPNMFATPLDSMDESGSNGLIDEILSTWVEEIFNDFGEAVLLTKISSEVIKRAEHYHMPLSDPNEWKVHLRTFFSARHMQFDIADAHTGSTNGSILVKRKM
jgi:hypothetical protein